MSEYERWYQERGMYLVYPCQHKSSWKASKIVSLRWMLSLTSVQANKGVFNEVENELYKLLFKEKQQ